MLGLHARGQVPPSADIVPGRGLGKLRRAWGTHGVENLLCPQEIFKVGAGAWFIFVPEDVANCAVALHVYY